MAADGELDEISKKMKRDASFTDDAGFKDAGGESIKMGLWRENKENQFYPPFGEAYLKRVPNTKIRDDDTIVCGFPKTGCHWIWETMSMILKGKGEYSPMGKVEGFLEMVLPELPEGLPSPRILNTHYRYNQLPTEALKKKTKLVFTTRNPKDTAASLYNHHIRLKDVYNYNGKFNDWFPLFMEGKVEYGDYFDYHVSWDKAIRENPDHPILVFRYEDMKEDFPSVIRKLAKFLGVNQTEAQVQEIADATNFSAMKTAFKDHPTGALIRKGEVGDWKNWLTVAQSEMIDARCKEVNLDGTVFNPRYEL